MRLSSLYCFSSYCVTGGVNSIKLCTSCNFLSSLLPSPRPGGLLEEWQYSSSLFVVQVLVLGWANRGSCLSVDSRKPINNFNGVAMIHFMIKKWQERAILATKGRPVIRTSRFSAQRLFSVYLVRGYCKCHGRGP